MKSCTVRLLQGLLTIKRWRSRAVSDGRPQLQWAAPLQSRGSVSSGCCWQGCPSGSGSRCCGSICRHRHRQLLPPLPPPPLPKATLNSEWISSPAVLSASLSLMVRWKLFILGALCDTVPHGPCAALLTLNHSQAGRRVLQNEILEVLDFYLGVLTLSKSAMVTKAICPLRGAATHPSRNSP